MYHDGIQLQRANHLGYRYGDPERDQNLSGDPIESNYVVIVSKKDCRTYEKDGRRYYDASDAPSIPMTHGGTYYGYGKVRRRTTSTWTTVNGEEVSPGTTYYTTPYYMVKDGVVYQGTLRNLKVPIAAVYYLKEHQRNWMLEALDEQGDLERFGARHKMLAEQGD